MTKKTLRIILIAVFLMIIGLCLFFFPLLSQTTIKKPVVYTAFTDFQHIEIDLEKTNLTICDDEITYIEIIGYKESEYYISETDGKLLLTDQFEKANIPLKLSGLGKYIKECFSQTEPKSIVLHLSKNAQQTPINLIVKNSNLTLSAPIAYLTLHAATSSITADNLQFERFNAKLQNCDSSFAIPYQANAFSRNIETHDAILSLNGDERANAEQFTSDFQKPLIKIDAFGGICRLVYSHEDS